MLKSDPGRTDQGDVMQMINWPTTQATRNEEGFSLLEVIIAMIVLLIALTGIAGLYLTNITTVALARERLAANQLSQEAMEILRALPYQDVEKGSTLAHLALDVDSPVPGTPTVFRVSASDYRLFNATGNEIVGAAPTTPAVKAPLARPAAVTTLNGVDYHVRSYITRAAVHGQNVLQGNVVVVWRDTRSQFQRFAVQTTLTSDIGCSSSVTHPFAGPCQAFFYANADVGDAQVSVRSEPGVTVLSTPGTQGEIHLGTARSQIQSEQVSLGVSSVVQPWTATGSTASALTSPLTDPADLRSDDDPATVAPIAPTSVEYGPATTILPAASGLTGSSAPVSSDRGRQRTVAGPGGTCQTPDTPQLQTAADSRCASADLLRSTVGLQRALPTGLGLLRLAELSEPTQVSRSLAAVSPTTAPGICTATAGSRCASARAFRVMPEVRLAGFPGSLVSALRIEAMTERLHLQAGPGSGGAVVERRNGGGTAPRLYWRTNRGSAETVITLAGQGSLTLPQARDTGYTYLGDPVTVVVTPSLIAPPAAVQALPNCTVSCKSSLQLAPVLTGTLDYRIEKPDGSVLGRWTISLGLGTPTASVTYQAAPGA